MIICWGLESNRFCLRSGQALNPSQRCLLGWNWYVKYFGQWLIMDNLMYVSLEQKKPFAATRDILPQKQKFVAFFFSPQKFRFSDTIFFRFQPLFSSFFFVPRSMKSPFCSATCITMFLILIQCSDAFLNIQKRLTQQKILFSFILSLSRADFFVAVASHVFHVLFFLLPYLALTLVRS